MFRSHGGKRAGAGRKQTRSAGRVVHRPRPALASRHPVHVTLRVKDHVWNLRARRCFRHVAKAFRAATAAREKRGFRLNEYSVQGNHLHLIVEAADAGRLARGLQSLEIRIAKNVNKVMDTHGAVFAERYHAHILRTPAEVRNALAYVRGNFTVHAQRRGEPAPSRPDDCSSVALVGGKLPDEDGPPLVSPARTWLLAIGWLRAAGTAVAAQALQPAMLQWNGSRPSAAAGR